MQKKACIFVFSGTGMTNYVVSKIKDESLALNLSLEVYKIENTFAKDITISDYDIIGIAYPVHSFNAPKIVIDFTGQLPNGQNTKTFIISSAGDKSVLNLASSNLLMRVLEKKNYDVFYNKQYIMPSNFIVKNDDKVVSRRLENVNAEAVQTANAIYENISYKEKPKIISKAISAAGRLEWIGAKRMSKYFFTDSNCTGCQLCGRLCPNKNIIMEGNNISFKNNCGLCMRCIYICPHDALKIRRSFRFISIGSWYTNEELRYKE